MRYSPYSFFNLSITVLLILFSLLVIGAGANAEIHRTIKVATYDYPPVVFKDKEGRLQGVQVEIFKEIAKREGWEVEYIHGNWIESLERLEHKEVDLLLGVGYSEQRARRYSFNEEAFLRNWGQLYTQKGRNIKELSDLQGARIALYHKGILSTSLRDMLADTGIEATYIEAADYNEILTLLDLGEVDAGVVSRLYGIYNAHKYSAVATPIIFMPSELRIAAPLHANPTMLNAIDTWLREFKGDRQSFYYDAVHRWAVDVISNEPGRYRLPRWVGYLLALLGGGALLLLGVSILLDRKVKERTQELKNKNKLLRIEMKEKERTENTLREHERQLSTLMDNIPGLVYRCSGEKGWNTEFVSKASQEILGLDPEYLLDNAKSGGIWNLIHPDDRHEAEVKRKAALDEGSSYQIMYRICARTGIYKWICDYGIGIKDGRGELIGIEGIIADITQQQEAEINLRHENQKLRSVMKERLSFGEIVGGSSAMQEVYENILKAAASGDPVVITGESGTGKELVARTVHEMSQRSSKPFIPVNCGAIPENLLESEFFGFKKGAFTGADTDREGFLAAANGGTLFLDEIGDISLSMQVKLLRALDGGGYTPMGSNDPVQVDTRVISATNKDVLRMVQDGTMREDFYYRIHIIPIILPPLRERRSDIPLLVEHFLERYPKDTRPVITGKIMEAFHDYYWPGNVRELQNILKRYFALKEIPFGLEQPDETDTALIAGFSPQTRDLRSVLSQFEKEYLLRTLKQNDWHRGKVADILRINRKTLYKKIQSFNLFERGSE